MKTIRRYSAKELRLLMNRNKNKGGSEAQKCDHDFVYESTSGGGMPAGFERSSGKGINSRLSVGGNRIRPSFQSAFACSMRSFLDDTKFHQMNRSPSGSPPSSNSVAASLATITGSTPLVKTSICPAL